MIRRLGLAAIAALALAVPPLVAQDPAPVQKPKKPAVSTEPWPEDEVVLAARTAAQDRRLFQDTATLDFTLTSDFGLLNRERTPSNGKAFPGVLTVDGRDIPVKVGSRGHLRLSERTCDFVPIKVDFPPRELAGTSFEGQTSLKLGTHCRDERDFDQYVIREYLAYKLANLATPLSFRARLARATYVDAKSNRKISTRHALFLEHENDVARRLGGRQVRTTHMIFKDFDPGALTTMMLLEYMLGNIDYSIWSLHNVVVVQDKMRKFYPIPYDFDLSGMVHPPYAAPDPRLPMRSATDRLYRGPCRPPAEMEAVAAPFRARKAEMLAAIDAERGLNRTHRGEMKDYLEAFFDRIATPQSIKKTFVDGCPANRGRV
jgi:hypothetical protein